MITQKCFKMDLMVFLASRIARGIVGNDEQGLLVHILMIRVLRFFNAPELKKPLDDIFSGSFISRVLGSRFYCGPRFLFVTAEMHNSLFRSRLKTCFSIEVQLTAAVKDFRARHNKIENCLSVWTQTRKNAKFATDQLGYALQNRS